MLTETTRQVPTSHPAVDQALILRFPVRIAFFPEPCYAAAMQITVNIPDEIAARVEALGQTPQSYVESLIEGAEQSTSLPIPRRLRPEISMDEFLRGMTAHSEKIPQLPDRGVWLTPMFF